MSFSIISNVVFDHFSFWISNKGHISDSWRRDYKRSSLWLFFYFIFKKNKL